MTPPRCSRLFVVALLCVPAPLAFAQTAPVPALEERARGADRVVVGRVVSTQAAWQVTESGDRLIVTTLTIAVTEILKGAPGDSVDVEVEGGTIGDLTLRVSDLPTFAPGDRAVFYLARTQRGVHVPHLRGFGLLRLDPSDRIERSGLTLDEIRRAVAAAR